MTNDYSENVTTNNLSLWTIKKPLLTWLDIELTERCNLNCIHCYINLPQDDKQAKKKELTTDELKSILTEAASLGCLTVRFTGGEPLLRKDFSDIYVHTRKLGIKVLLFTNATLITPEIIDLFMYMPPLQEVEVTVYGMKKKSYESVTRSPDSYKSAMKGIDRLMKADIPFILKTTMLPQNKSDISLFRKWSLEFPLITSDPSINLLLNLRCRFENNKKNHRIKSLRASSDDILKMTKIVHHNYLDEMKHFLSHFYKPPDSNIFTCSGDKSICVDAYGNYQLCMLLRHPDTVVNFKKYSLKSAINVFFPGLLKIQSTRMAYLDKCAKCFLKSICDQCPANSYMEHGTLDTPVEYYCEITHKNALYLGLVEKDEYAWEVSNEKKRITLFTQK